MSTPDLACIVLSLGSPPELVDALTSLLVQAVPIEIVVVSSASTDTAVRLGQAGLYPQIVERSARLYPGGARNLGIAATRARWISFLAADCLAEPGWIAGRLAAHRGGAAAVASAVTNPYPHSLAAWASHVALFARRLAGVPEGHALRYGASYDRRLFDQLGGFREDLRAGEDTEWHQRLAAAGYEVSWAPAVQTGHRHPRGLLALWRDQRARGRRMVGSWGALGGPSRLSIARDVVARQGANLALALRSSHGRERRWILASTPLLAVAACAYALGALEAPATSAGPSRGLP